MSTHGKVISPRNRSIAVSLDVMLPAILDRALKEGGFDA